MWLDHHHPQRGVSSSTSKSYSSNSSSSSCILQPAPRKARTIDEVWNNITHQNHYGTTTVTPHHTSTRGMILQDFLAGPILKETIASSTTQPPHLPPDMSAFPPATILSLNSTGFDFIVRNKLDQNHTHLSSSPFMTTTLFPDRIGSPGPGLLPLSGKKRLSEQPSLDSSGDGTGDHRHKRMIKNRESAARSRARKQAYTNELELEVTHLNEENQKLRKQFEEMRMALAAQAPTKKKLHRTSTAPF